MSRYVENNLGKNENVVKKAHLNPLFLVGTWIKGILLCWLLLIPTVKALWKTIVFCNIELAITNKRVIGKVGVLNTAAMDAPLNKVQNISVAQPFFGKLFNYGTIKIDTAAGSYTYEAIKSADAFKRSLSIQIDQAEEDRAKQQAEEMARAMATAIKKDGQ